MLPCQQKWVTILPLLIVVLLILMVATFGFWDTLEGVLGGIGIAVLLVLLAGGAAAAAIATAYRRVRR